MIEILRWATDKVTARNFLVACNVADYDATTQTLNCREGFQLHPFRASEDITVVQTPAVLDETGTVITPAVIAPGVHFNVRICGAPEQALIDAAYNPANPPTEGHLWSRLKLVTYVSNKLSSVATAMGKSVTGARLPIGYEWTVGAKVVRLYDASKVNNRSNVWA